MNKNFVWGKRPSNNRAQNILIYINYIGTIPINTLKYVGNINLFLHYLKSL